MVVLCYHQVQAFGRPGPITGSPRGRRRARPRRSNVVFTPVTTHSSGREKVTVSRWCGHEWLNCGLKKPCDTSYYMLSEPCHVARPLSCTAVRSRASADRLGGLPRKASESRSEPERAGRWSVLGSVNMFMHPTHPVLACVGPGAVTERSRGRQEGLESLRLNPRHTLGRCECFPSNSNTQAHRLSVAI